MDSQEKFDYIIVGAGVFGLTAAIELKSRNPDRRILVLDPGPIPHRHAASTDISKVILMDYGDDQHYVAMMEDSFPIWKKWNQEWKEQVYFETGLLAAVESMEPESYEYQTMMTLRKRGHKIEELDKNQLKTRFPAWAESRVGYFNPVGGWARSGLVVENLHLIAVSTGVNVQYGAVKHLLYLPVEIGKKKVCTGVQTINDERFYAPLVVVAAGASTPLLLPEVRTIMWPTAQPVFHFEVTEPHKFPLKQFPVFFSSITKTGFYGFPVIEEHYTKKIAPRKVISTGTGSTQVTKEVIETHRIKVGQHGPGWRLNDISDQSLAELWAKVESHEEKKIRNWLNVALPDLAKSKIVYTRLCIYCDTFDGDFLIDYVPDVDGLFVASGGSGHGFKFAPVLGDIIASAIEKQPHKFTGRFVWRNFQSGKKEAARHLEPQTLPQTLASL